jgi:HprK-related kinase A
MIYFPGRKIFFIDLGPFLVKATTNIGDLIDLAQCFYPYSLSYESAGRIADIHVELLRILPLRRWQLKRMVFLSDLENPYPTLPLEHHYPFFEWGLNWCIAMQAHQYLMLHSAVLEKHGKALILPALPGSGKSTLCAALTLRGWRLFSDEFGMYRPETRDVIPMPRPMPLKNQSIEVIREFAPNAPLGPRFRATPKGDVCHVQVSEGSVRRQKEPAHPEWIVFPQFKRDAVTRLYDFAKGRAFLKLAENSFNYKLQGERGFRAVADLVRRCATHYLAFDSLEHATAELDRLCGSA